MLTLREPIDALVLIPHLIGYIPKRTMVLCGLDSSTSDAYGQRWLTGPLFQYDYTTGGLTFECAEVIGAIIREHNVGKAVIALYCDSVEEFFDEEQGEQLRMIHWAAQLSQKAGSFLATFAVDKDRYIRVDVPGVPVALTQLDSREIAAQLVYYGSAPRREEIVKISEKECEDAAKAALKAHGLTLSVRVEALRALMREETERDGVKRLHQEASVECTLTHDSARRYDPGQQQEKGSENPSHNSSISSERNADSRECVKEDEGEGNREYTFSNTITVERLGEMKTSEAVGIASEVLCDLQVRDSALLWALSGTEMPRDRIMDTEEVARALGKIMRAKPQIDWLERSVQLLDLIAAHKCIGSDEALAMSAYVYWWMGRNQSADTRAKASLTRNSGNTLAGLMRQALAEGLLPPWRDIHSLDNSSS